MGKIPWRRKWQLAPVFLPVKSHGQRSLVATCSPGCCKESDRSEHTHTHTPIQGGPCSLVVLRPLWPLQGPCFSVFLFCLCLILPPSLRLYESGAAPYTPRFPSSPPHSHTGRNILCSGSPRGFPLMAEDVCVCVCVCTRAHACARGGGGSVCVCVWQDMQQRRLLPLAQQTADPGTLVYLAQAPLKCFL